MSNHDSRPETEEIDRQLAKKLIHMICDSDISPNPTKVHPSRMLASILPYIDANLFFQNPAEVCAGTEFMSSLQKILTNVEYQSAKGVFEEIINTISSHLLPSANNTVADHVTPALIVQTANCIRQFLQSTASEFTQTNVCPAEKSEQETCEDYLARCIDKLKQSTNCMNTSSLLAYS